MESEREGKEYRDGLIDGERKTQVENMSHIAILHPLQTTLMSHVTTKVTLTNKSRNWTQKNTTE